MKNLNLLLNLLPLLFTLYAVSVSAESDELSCIVTGEASCKIIDTSTHFNQYLNLPCNQLPRQFIVDRSKVASGFYNNGEDGVTNERGFPQINVVYKWKTCNRSAIMAANVRLYSFHTSAKLRNQKQTPQKVRGLMKVNNCKVLKVQSSMDTELRYHPISFFVKAYLEMKAAVAVEETVAIEAAEYNTTSVDKNGMDIVTVTDTIYASAESVTEMDSDSDEVTCSDYKFYQTRLKYSDDCQVSASAECYLLDPANQRVTNTPCEGNIPKAPSPDECEDIPVQYFFRACNNEDREVRVKRSKSKYKVNGNVIGRVDGLLLPSNCENYFHDTTINTCAGGDTSTWSSIGIQGKGALSKMCKDYSSLKVGLVEPEPERSGLLMKLDVDEKVG